MSLRDIFIQDLLEKTKELERKHSKRKSNPVNLEKGPRYYASEILSLPADQRDDAISKIPPHLFTWVMEYVNDTKHEARTVNSQVATISKLALRQDRIDALAKVPEQYREQVKAAVIKMMGK